MTNPVPAAPGTWWSPVSADLVCHSSIEFADLAATSQHLYWTERRPAEGRTALVRCAEDGMPADVVPAPWSVTSSVHEYGGKAFVADRTTVFFSSGSDQRLYRLDDEGEPRAITALPSLGAQTRYVAPILSGDSRWLICVRETHSDAQVDNDLVAVATDGSLTVVGLVDGHDFFGAPAISPDGTKLAWTTWNRPDMPWDGTQLWEADVVDGPQLTATRLVAGSVDESIVQPQYRADGVLGYLSDATGWWSPYLVRDGRPVAMAASRTDLAAPDWMAGQTSYAYLDSGELVAISAEEGRDHLVVLRPGASAFERIDGPYTYLHSLSARGNQVFVVGASATSSPAVLSIDLAKAHTTVVRPPAGIGFPEEYVSAPRSMFVPTGSDVEVHAFYYPPTNPEFVLPDGIAPPLVVNVHGGPTHQAPSAFNSETQYWTTRGYAYLDVNYRGSAGFGRAYRRALYGNWGVADVADCTAAAEHVARIGLADPEHMMIRGRSAGGYTALMCLATGSTFSAGASYWGVTDLGLFADETHKFESGYLCSLVGASSSHAEEYRRRSPVTYADQITAAIAVFQGSTDRIVPISQAERLVGTLVKNGIEHTYLVFEGEGHGLQKASNAERALEAEAQLYARVLGLEAVGRPV